MKTKTFPAATAENVTYTWDSTAGGNKGKGRLTSITYQLGSMAWVYDGRGNVVSETRTIQGKSYTTAYAYTANDDISQITYPSGRIVTIARNAIGRKSSIKTHWDASVASFFNVATTFTWKPMAELIDKFTYGNGLTFDAGYDLDYRLTSLKVQDGGTDRISLSYAYGDGLNLTAITDNVAAANNASLGYYRLNRLYSAAGPWGQKVFNYDRTGNLTQEQSTVSGTTTTRTLAYPSTSNRISSETTDGTTTRSFTYDGAGNTLTGLPAGSTYAATYNKRGRPAGLTLNGAPAATYLFNAQEQLVSRTLLPPLVPQANTTHYLYDLDGHLIAEASGTSASNAVITREYIWLNDMPIAVVDNVDTASPLTRYVHTDHLLRPIMMTGGAKGTVWSATWTPWGTAQTLSGSAIQNLRFPGQYFLIEQGLHYNWHRFYDPTLGRYTQPDPLGFPDGPARYAYAGNSPLMRTDADGRQMLPYTLPRVGPTLDYLPFEYLPPSTIPPFVDGPTMGPKVYPDDDPAHHEWRFSPDEDWPIPPYPGEFPTDDGNHCNRVKDYCFKVCNRQVNGLDFDFTPWPGKGSRSDSFFHCRKACNNYFGCPDPGVAWCEPDVPFYPASFGRK